MADHPSSSSSPASVEQPDGRPQFCLCQPEPKIPRPRNAFILYRQHQQAAVVRNHPGLPNPAISKIIGEQWSRLPEEEKDKWKALAEEEKARHAQQYPEYRYQPRRNGRYSSQSSGSGPTSGGKVDQNGNCIKCGGKTMNPPTAPYTGHRGSQQMFVSPPRTGMQPHRDGMWIPQARHDPRFDPRQRYMSEQTEGPDLKRRRFDNGYVGTREVYREVPYPYSPREAHYVQHDPHAPRSTMGPPPRVLYPQAPPLPPKLQAIRPPPPQHERNPSLTLPPLTTSSGTPSSSIARQASQNSGLEAMIMSIPVLNKVKILSQISPHLPAPSVVSPPREIRGAIVAVEGLDPSSVYSMTNSLAELLVKDGKFSIHIFSGPDPFASLRDDGTGKGGRKELAIADCLRIIGEWHKISEDMKKFITTRPAPSGQVSPDKDVEMSSMSNSIVVTDVSTKDPWPKPEAKTTHHSRRPRSLDLNPPTKKTIQASEEQPTSASRVSPKSIVTDKTANLSISTPLVQPPGQWRDPWYKGDGPDSPVYTRIPPTAQRGSGNSPAPQSKDTEMEGTEKEKEKQAHFDISADQTFPKPNNSTSAPTPNYSISHHAITGDGPTPIALVPYYQLTTVDASAISVPIVDSYSPLAHWQWLATLWRGCIGPDVSVVIQSTAVAGEGSVQGSVSVPPGSNEDSSPGKMCGASGGMSRDANRTPVPGSRTASVATGAGTGVGSAPSSGNAGHTSSVSGLASNSAAQGAAAGPGVEVRLLDCRAVVVRTNVSAHKHGKKGNENMLRRISEGGEEKTGESGAEGTTQEMGVGHVDTGVVDPEKEKKIREDLEFWEKAKRRVGFEVAEFLRR